jgi:hypothetical protein
MVGWLIALCAPGAVVQLFSASSVTKEFARQVESDHYEYLATADSHGLRKQNNKGCWRTSEACRKFGFNPQVVSAAQRVTKAAELGERLFLVSVTAVRRVKGGRQYLHNDLDLFTPQCSTRGSATVWVLAETDVDPLPRPPISVISGTHAIVNQTAQELRATGDCDIDTGFHGKGNRPLQNWKCRLAGVASELQRLHPQLSTQLIEGPRSVNGTNGMVWLGGTWHQVDDEAGRLALMAHYGTEACVRSLRVPRSDDFFNPSWRGTDWVPFIAVPQRPVSGASARMLTTKQPDMLDPLLNPQQEDKLGRDGMRRSGGGRCSHPFLFQATSTLQVQGRVHAVHPSDFPPVDAPTRVFNDGLVASYVYKEALASPHIEYLGAIWSRKSVGPNMAHLPHSEITDEIDVLLDGHVTYAASYNGSCGTFNVMDGQTGTVAFFPSGISHTARARDTSTGKHPVAPPPSLELLLKIQPRGRARRIVSPSPRRLATEAAWNMDVLLTEKGANSATATGGTRPTPRVHTEHALFHGEPADGLGYSHLVGKVTSFGPWLKEEPRAEPFDIIVVPLSGAAITIQSVAGTLRIEPTGLALVPAGTKYAFMTESTPVDVLTVEIAVANPLPPLT